MATFPARGAGDHTGNTGSIASIRRLGGKIQIDPTRSGKPVIEIDLSNTKVTDDDLALLKQFQLVRRIDLSGTKIRGGGLIHFRDLKHLSYLDLHQSKIDKNGLKNLRNLTGLESLGLSFTSVTDADLVNLTSLTKLKWLFLTRTKVTAHGLSLLTKLSNLEWLSIDELTDDGLKQLSAFPKLKILVLRSLGRGVTKTGMVHLQNH
jgi:hypothetical protein